MNEPEKSDNSIVSKKPANKAGREARRPELAEKRGLAKGNPSQQTSHRTQNRERLQHALERIRQAVNWMRFDHRIARRWMLRLRVVHPYPEHRLSVMT